MENLLSSDEFVKQFGGSASANLVFVAAFVVVTCCRKLCNRKSKCHSTFHSCCLDVDIQDRSQEGELSITVEV